ncbi:diaminopimelate epimerase [Natronosporangium hydrolyticum]|uniref:Diaminopimelate epimerase n=1 Tax=Natronosporangium hydrolyticum TaxID=2811111 RepID=A0A895YPI7_9ACTN|nr:diaminopimelate epimerase [Natronosporangium hydrolyticum]QSB17399.1 diaminopimelate epimerase [Natronosporangium hydrolyticum]
MEFTKGQGTGNDFVIIPDPEGALILTPELVTGLCDRRFGIGADGVLRVVRTAADPELAADPQRYGGAEWFMDYRNADGSIAEMCGNGVRVFARYLVARELVATSEFLVGTRSGQVAVVVSEEAVSATMGHPRLLGETTARLGGQVFTGTAVDCGNPHLVCPLPRSVRLTELELTAAPVVDPGLFPDGVNVEFTEPVTGEPAGPDHVRMRVYERGVGETLSCGSGACAAAAVTLHRSGQAAGLATVDVPGGRLTVAITAEECALTGAAVLVAQGTVFRDALAAPTV